MNYKRILWGYKIPKTNSFLAIGLYSLISVIVMGFGFFTTAIDPYSGILISISGMAVFSFTEYIIHRFLYHSGKDFKNEKYWQYKIHGVHHLFPRDLKLLAMPILLAFFIAGLLFFGLFVLWGDSAYFFWPGFMLGYAVYLYIHYVVHARKPPNNFFRFLWTHHALHHYIYEDKAFGVSSPLWDIVFGTMPPKRKKGLKTSDHNTPIGKNNNQPLKK